MTRSEISARYYARHKEKCLIATAKWQRENKDKRNAIGRRWYASHREQKLSSLKEYHKKPEVAARVHERKTTEKYRKAGRRYTIQKNVRERNACLSAYGEKCACCGESNKRFLTLDHVNGDGASHRKTIRTSIYSWTIKNGFPNTLQVLCFNCNHGRYLNGGICPHRAGG